jgi:ferredoxin
MPYIVTSACIQCGACSSGCESNAITDGDTQSIIDVTLCIECGTCERNCPSEAIIFVEEENQSDSHPGLSVPEVAKDPA